MSNKLYDEKFYKSQIDGSYRSAVAYVHHLSEIFTPNSVADLGCGRGTWLKAFGESGATKLVGFDGNWNSQEQMIDEAITFTPADLNKPLSNSIDRFDLAVSLEVAEHLKKESSVIFVRNLTSLSDVVMFGAAFENQGGADHINEQLHTYWAKLFIESGYLPYDVFRPTMWGNNDIDYWYQQNTFLYVKSTSIINRALKEAGYQPISNLEFMNCVHPRLYDMWVNRFRNLIKRSIKSMLNKIVPKNIKLLAKKLRKQYCAF